MSKKTDPQYPASRDLIDQISFDTETGKIWLHEQRMLLVYSSLFANLRRELVTTMGSQRARGVMMRLGYHSGWRDAGLARKLRPEMSDTDAFLAGPQLALIKGMVNVKPTQLEFNVQSGSFHAEFEWEDAFEAELHLQEFGAAKHPVCWFLISYASGFTSYFMGKKIFYKELECLGCGAKHCRIIGKPSEEWEDSEELERTLQPDAMAEDLLSLQNQLDQLQENLRKSTSQDDFLANAIGRSTRFRQACQLLERAAKTPVTVLLQGETGVGEEIFAKALHHSSPRSSKPFISVNCACIPPDLIEAELFGVEKGSLTGATTSREGKFESANGGTIFLNEVLALPPRAQSVLLRVLQDGTLERFGSTETRPIDVRLVAATHEDLAEAVRAGKFRADLFYRLNVYPVKIPALRDRKEDIPLLVEYFLTKHQALYQKATGGVTDKAMKALMEYSWPGNISELENMIERGVILTDNNQTIDLETFFPSFIEPGLPPKRIEKNGSLRPTPPSSQGEIDSLCEELLRENFNLQNFEVRLLRAAMIKSDGNVTKAAHMLGLTHAQMAYRLEQLEAPRFF